MKNTSELTEESSFIRVIRTVRSSRKDAMKRVVKAAKLGGIAEGCLSSQVYGAKGIFYALPGNKNG